jgi:hypothetical protein
LEAGIRGDGEEDDENPRHDGGDGHGALAADVFDVDGVAGDDAAGHADDRGDGIVAVGDVGGVFAAAAAAGEVLGEEGWVMY